MVAAVDLGSNSFHLIVAQVHQGRPQMLDRMKEMVRLAAGLDGENNLNPAAMQRAMTCLKRFGQRLRGIPPGNVRIVGTNTLRKARNRVAFMAAAREALGHEIDIIAGREEARLIYLGVSHSLEDDFGRRLVIDIGGGSTELIVGQQFQPERAESLHMGCVEMSARFFKDGLIDPARIQAAKILALQELEPIAEDYRRIGWDSAIGASGTILAVQEVCAQHGWCKSGVSPAALAKLIQALINAGHIDKLALTGLQPDRAPVFPGGVAIVAAIFEALDIKHMQVSNGALREGLLYDLLGRIHHEDVREGTVADLLNRYRIDPQQARRVSYAARALFEYAAVPWRLRQEDDLRLLRWAGQLHEIGLIISHSQYQKHGAYLVQNMDMPGFSQREQILLALLIRSHRRKFPMDEFKALGDWAPEQVFYLCVLLRLAVLLHRSHSETPLPALGLEAGDQSLKLLFPPGWLDEHPLTRVDLEQEAGYLKTAGMKLKFK
jgi:exopolyphosphatase/guanosine-5'-triphosphate,3'-diphosphate pyrophosphatase